MPASSFGALVLAVLLLFCGTVHGETQPTLVIIIDDMGNQWDTGERATKLPGKINLAFLPHTPNCRLLAQQAYAQGKEVMLHAPMANVNERPLGPGALTPAMNEGEFRETLLDAIHNIPHLRGVNNHMGSQLTQMSEPMHWLMEELGRHQLYFVDSRTSVETVAASTAEELDVPHLSRHVFLDNERNSAAIDAQFQQFLFLAQRDGIAVAIGHPYVATMDYLEKKLPTLAEQGFKLALVSEVLNYPPVINRQAP